MECAAISSPASLDETAGVHDIVTEQFGTAIREVSLSYFLDALLPPVEHGLGDCIDAIKADLITRGAIVEGQWRDFSEDFSSYARRWESMLVDPANETLGKSYVRGSLQSLGHEIAVSAKRVSGLGADALKPTAKFVCHSSGVSMYATRDNKAKPDEYAQLLASSIPRVAQKLDYVYWDDIAVVGEWQGTDSWKDVNEVRRDLIMFCEPLSRLPRMLERLLGHSNRRCSILLAVALFLATPSKAGRCGYGFVIDRKSLFPSHSTLLLWANIFFSYNIRLLNF